MDVYDLSYFEAEQQRDAELDAAYALGNDLSVVVAGFLAADVEDLKQRLAGNVTTEQTDANAGSTG